MSTGSRRGVGLLLVEVAVAAVAGGLMAMGVLAFDEGDLDARFVLLLVAIVTLLAVLAVGTLLFSRPERPGPDPEPWTPAEATPSWPAPGRPQVLAPGAGTATPDRAPSRGGPGFRDDPRQVDRRNSAPPLPTFSRPEPAVPEQVPDLRPPAFSSHPVRGARETGRAAVRRIVQCPHCGDFDVDLREEGGVVAFTCRPAGHAWTWSRGAPWPSTVVRPALPPRRPARGPDSA